jgi:prepilin-type N-terminal cleavage/methylation domain-containing protein
MVYLKPMYYSARVHGYTLVELLIVIALIAIVAYLGAAVFVGTRVKATNSRAESEIAQIGTSVESFKQLNNGLPLIVQQPYAPSNPSLIEDSCFASVPQASCYPTNLISPDGNNGFTSSLFSGMDSPNYYNVDFSVAAANDYVYSYITEDCSSDSIASSGGYHKISKYPDYLVVTGLTPDATGASSDNFWVKDGVAGRGPDTAVPLLPFFNPTAITPATMTGTQTNCSSNYP